MKTRMLTLATLLTIGTGCLADIRPDAMSDLAQPVATDESKGRDLLRRAAEAQGLAAFQEFQTYQMVVEDRYQGLLGRAGKPWPDVVADLRLSYKANTFDGRAEFLSGKKEGWTWGLQAWKTYQVSPEAEVSFEKNDDAKFVLPAIQYLTEFVFRDHRDQVVSYAGSETIDGVDYERVYLTWSAMEPSKKHDQYLAYIDARTGLLRKLQYTVRDLAGFVKATIHFDDYRNVAGVLVAHRQSVTGSPRDDADDYLHRISVKAVAFGTPSLATFVVDDGLPSVGDQKLATR